VVRKKKYLARQDIIFLQKYEILVIEASFPEEFPVNQKFFEKGQLFYELQHNT
jgi:hypothetical protein